MHPTVFPSSFLPQDIPALEDHLCNLRAIWEKTKVNLESASLAQKCSADRRRRPPPVYHVGDKVWLSTRHIRLKVPSMKFAPRFIGLYRILRYINPVSYALQLPASLRIPNSFHVSLLKPLMCNRFTRPDSPPPVVVDGRPEYEVESILDSRRFRNRLQYLVHWKGYGSADRTWVSSHDIHAPRLVSAFHRRFLDKLAPGRPVGVPLGGGAVTPRRLVRPRRPTPRAPGSASPPLSFPALYARAPPASLDLAPPAAQRHHASTWVSLQHVTRWANQMAGHGIQTCSGHSSVPFRGSASLTLKCLCITPLTDILCMTWLSISTFVLLIPLTRLLLLDSAFCLFPTLARILPLHTYLSL
uniref:Chromo domain-containing protein n=1 Tax=Leptobrachium leishanense TaxID=445787 RepID=A0A8C5M3U7_9ANUR